MPFLFLRDSQGIQVDLVPLGPEIAEISRDGFKIRGKGTAEYGIRICQFFPVGLLLAGPLEVSEGSNSCSGILERIVETLDRFRVESRLPGNDAPDPRDGLESRARRAREATGFIDDEVDGSSGMATEASGPGEENVVDLLRAHSFTGYPLS